MTHQNFDASITPSTVSSNESEGKRNRKTQLLSALLSASALGLFLEGCGGGDGGGGGGGGGVSGDGSEENPFLATADADTFDGLGNDGWVTYAGSNEGVTIDLNYDAPPPSGGWADGDELDFIYNLIGSAFDDTLTGNNLVNFLEGGRGNDALTGEGGDDSYAFSEGDGSDKVDDPAGNVIFKQGTNDDYAGATYTFVYVDDNGSRVRLTVTKGGNTLNTIEFSTYPVEYDFYTSSDGVESKIPDSSINLPTGRGGENNPFLATSGDDVFGGAGIYDWVSYAGSTSGVTIELGRTATVSRGWAAGDTLKYIDNLIGSAHADTLTGDFGVNTLRGGAGNDILEGKGNSDTLEGGAGQDDYIFDDSDDTIRSDPDGGRLLFRAASGASEYDVSRDSNGDIVVSVGEADITIADGGADDAYQDGSYAIYYGASDSFIYNLYAGSHSADTITGSNGHDIIYGLGSNDKLYGWNGNDEIDGGSGNDLLDGGKGDNILYGGSGDDTYRFDAGTGISSPDQREGGLIYDPDTSGNNKVIFRAPQGVTYTDDNFYFVRGTFNAGGADPFIISSSGRDLLIRAFTGSINNADIKNTVVIETYFFGQASNYDIYTIYRTGYNSNSDGTIVSTQPAETA